MMVPTREKSGARPTLQIARGRTDHLLWDMEMGMKLKRSGLLIPTPKQAVYLRMRRLIFERW